MTPQAPSGAKLVVVDGRTASDGPSVDIDTLVLDEGVLLRASGSLEVLADEQGAKWARDLAQSISERALADVLGESDGSVRNTPAGAARLVAAVSKLDVYVDVQRFATWLVLVERALALVVPTVVEWRTDDGGAARAVVARLGSGVPVRVVRAPASSGTRAERWLRRVKRDRWEWTVRAVAGLADALRSPGHTMHSADVLGVFDVRNAGMIANVASVAAALRDQGASVVGVAMDLRVARQAAALVETVAICPFAAFARAVDVGRAVARAPAVRRALRQFATDAFEDPSERAAACFAFARLHVGYVAQTLFDAETSEHLLDRLRPRVVLVASDAHRYARLLVLAARARGVASAVLQHGALVGDHFYVPVVADRMLAWGPWCRDWFVDRGTPPDRVEPVGFVRAPDRRAASSPDAAGARCALYAGQPVPDHVTRDLLARCRDALEGDPWLRLRVRPHPGEGRRALLAEVVAGWPATVRERVELSPPERSLKEDLEAADVVLASQSTVAIDALAAGVPVVTLRHEAVREAIPFRAFACTEEATSGAELLDALGGVADPARAAARAKGADAFLDAYLGRAGVASTAAAAAAVRALRGCGNGTAP